MLARAALRGLVTLVPGADGAITGIRRRPPPGARYTYSIWFRHLVNAHECGGMPKLGTIAELGPGRCLGVGIAALLSGANRYRAFDLVSYPDVSDQLSVVDDMVGLFSRREPIPGEREFPHVKPRLGSYEFPLHLLGSDRLDEALSPDRVSLIREAVRRPTNSVSNDPLISYVAPWAREDIIREDTVDFLLSQAVLEHVDDLEYAYDAMFRWLRPGGLMSHQIDFKSHGTARGWNGHWAHSDLVWKVIRGRRPYLLNRQPLSVHERLIRRCGFDILSVKRVPGTGGITRSQLARRFASFTDDDLATSGAFVVARKPAEM